VAERFRVAARSVRRLYERFAECADARIEPHYCGCGVRQAGRTSQEILDEAQQMRNDHPPWGAPLIRVLMQKADRHRSLPTPRTLQRWFKKRSVPAAPPGRRPALRADRAERPHEVWQMDAVEHVPLKTSRKISWLRVADEWTGAVLGTSVFPQDAFGAVGAARVQRRLRALFSRWGRPWRFRVDNGVP
jgi:hypothetical protein